MPVIDDHKNKILNILKKIKMDIANRQIDLIIECSTHVTFKFPHSDISRWLLGRLGDANT